MKKLISRSLVTFAVTVAALGIVTTAHATDEKNAKAIRVESGSGGGAVASGKPVVDFKGTKDVFEVDEPISFKIKSNKQVYVYVYSMDEKTQSAVQIFPNKYDKLNLLKPGKTVIMPSSKSVFKSDAAGVEHLILIASEKKLNLQHDEPAEGSFYDMDWKSLDSTVKSIRVESGEQAPKKGNGKLTKELDIIIQSR
jgi:Domain of unknown function (DUF4384)